MKTFKEFLESDTPASVNNNVGKPTGGKVKKGDESSIKTLYKGLGDRLKSTDTNAEWKREPDKLTDFQKLFQSASDEMKNNLNK